ncbi:hypothetical protein GGI25_002266 [Coemansia spiralis]|uniref:DIS3-like exonuclease 1 n=2 Tax=Coemansia TaxID=4863 RepID=A0A9W8GAT3_9FUNG|nr:hypothetical protein EDC05_001090 [Coemansia umbellata]KAJ2625652.1 hypothetical protein GGI26_000452 [Coemansia sp. RSA 1358]KAJ2678472.1 hypothetical protein GGI25_002266 [Coemansia spiralis]
MLRQAVVSDGGNAMRMESVAFRRSKRSGMAMSVIERYIRHDIPCAFSTCNRCGQNTSLRQRGIPMLDSASDILVADASVVSRFIELLEQHPNELTNIVFCQTVLDALDRRNRTRTIRNVRRITADPRRTSVVFANEVFADTILLEPRQPCESAVERDMRAVLQAANWYADHLAHEPVRIRVLTSDARSIYASGLNSNVEAWQLADYLAEFHPQLLEHFHTVREATGDMDITERTPLEYAQARLKAKAEGYAKHWSPSDIEDGLRTGALIKGKIRIVRASAADNKQPEGIVERGSGQPNIIVVGRAALNRACSGDTVVVRLLLAEREPSEQAEPNDSEDDAEEDPTEQIDAGDETEPMADQVRGTVVAIAERKWRPFVATLQPDEAGGNRHLAVPVDTAVPKIRIHYTDAAAIADRYFVVAIDGWPADSQYPQGHFIRALGPIGDLNAEIDTILVERQIAVSQAALAFSEASMREMPPSTWEPDAEEIGRRRDLRDRLVFSIDPRGSQDIDDAVSVRRLAGGRVELGVHIADVTQFIAPGSATDIEAQARGTTVYLADRRFNMIPEILSEHVCSLRSNRDRYAVSVVWTMDPACNVEQVWFGRTVIRSALEMCYEQAQALLDGERHVDGVGRLEETLRPSLVELTQIMRVLRERRRQNGALELASIEIKFEFDRATGEITELRPKRSLEIHRVIEEAMVFANQAVAKQIHQKTPAALLRRHRSPTSERFERLVRAARTRGFEIDCSSNVALADSLGRLAQAGDADLVFLAKSMATLAMQEADYFAGACDPDEHVHYGLALDHYTHFTSPIRRYADVIVHRQLLATLDGPVLSTQWVAAAAARLNERNRQAKLAQRESTELFQSRFVMQAEHLVADGVVAEVRTNGLIVYVPRFGLRGPVHLRDKSGQITVPLSALSGNPGDADRPISGCSGFAAEHDKLTIQLPLNVPVFHLGAPRLEVAVFDHVRVLLRVLETRRRRPVVYLTLLSRAADSKAYRSSLPSLDKRFRISAANAKRKEDNGTEAGSSHAVMCSSGGSAAGAAKGGACYGVLEKFAQLSLLEAASDVQGV